MKKCVNMVGAPRFELGTPCTPCGQSLLYIALGNIGYLPPSALRIGLQNRLLRATFAAVFIFILSGIGTPALASPITLTQSQSQHPAKPAPKKPSPPKPATATPPTAPGLTTNFSASLSQQEQQQQAQSQGQSQVAQGGSARAGSASRSTSGSTSGAAANNAGNDQSSAYSSSYQEVRQTPPAFAGTVQPTASCRNARNAGASSPVAAVSFGVSTKDEACDRRELAREFYEMGRGDLAIRVLCRDEAAKGLPDCEPRDEHVALVPADTVTHDELYEVERRIVERTVGK